MADKRLIPLLDSGTPVSGRDGTAIPVDQIGLFTGSIISPVAGTSYTLRATDNGKIVTTNSSSATTISIPAGLPNDFVCSICQGGSGQVTLTTGSGLITLNNADSQFKTERQHIMLTLVAFSQNNYRLFGRTAA